MGALEKALVHTLLGMGSVFVILIIMIFVISLFAFIPKIQAKFTKTKLDPGPNPAALPAAPVVEAETVAEDETDDLELVAVITAAVAASMGTASTDGFVVRSIKRAPTSRWKK